MLSFLARKAAHLVGVNKMVIVLFLLLISSSFLLANSYKANGVQSATIKVLEQNNDALALAYDKRLVEYSALQQKMMEREEKQDQVDVDLAGFRRDLAGFKNESNCIDMDLGVDFDKLLNPSTSSSD